MKELEIITIPKKTLRQPSKNIENISSAELKKIIRRMFYTMKKVQGVGLAAPQIDKNINLFVIDKELAKINNVPAAYFNAKIIKTSPEEEIMEEGCLSVPDRHGLVKRAQKIKLTATDETGKEFTANLDGFIARVIQHELDHINGILIVDKIIEVGKI